MDSGHADAGFSKKYLPYSGRVTLAGPCIVAVAVGLANTCKLRDTLRERHGIRPVALLAYENIVFKAPIFGGDTMTVEMEVLGARPTSKPNRAVVRMKVLARKQTGDIVMEMDQQTLYEKIPDQVPA